MSKTNPGRLTKKNKRILNIGCIILAAIVFIWIVRYVFKNKSKSSESMGNGGMYMANTSNQNVLDAQVKEAADADAPAKPSSSAQDPMNAFAQVDGIQGTAQGLPPSCNAASTLQADQLLPKDNNSDFQQLSPNGNGALAGINLLQAGYHNGIDTISSAMRNANLQVRSEPPNPTKKVSPWNETTISPDLMRVPLEIGCGPQ